MARKQREYVYGYDGTPLAMVCNTCDELKLLADMKVEQRSEHGVRALCKACDRERARRYHEAHRDNPEFRERKRERTHRFHEANPEKMREYDRRKRAAYVARTDAEVLADRARLRPDGLKKCRAGHFAPLDEFGDDRIKADGLKDRCRAHHTTLLKHAIERWEELDLWRCDYCGGPFEDIDHVVPRSRGGSDDPMNLRPSCANCNRGVSGKHAQTPAEWKPEEDAALWAAVIEIRRRNAA